MIEANDPLMRREFNSLAGGYWNGSMMPGALLRAMP